jgi:ankyrin repeat protein
MNHLLATTLAAVLFLGCHVDSIYTGPVEQAMFGDVCAGNIQEVKKFLDDGGNVNTQDEPGCTPLHWAVNEDFQGSHREMVKLLIDRGADVNAVDDIQTAPLHMASNKETAELLIDASAEVNAKDSEGRTILYTSARNAANASKTWKMYLGLAELLIEKGADVNVKDHSGETPLHVVARQFDEKRASEICELLIANGARVNEEDSKGQTPLDDALTHQRTETAVVLRKHGGKAAEELKAKGK